MQSFQKTSDYKLTIQQRYIKTALLVLAAISVVALTFLIFSSWVTVSSVVLGYESSFNLFQLRSMVNQVNATRDPSSHVNPMGIFQSRAIFYQIWGGLTILLMFGYIFLIFKNHRRSLLTGVLAFSSSILLTFVYINDVFNTNGELALRGRIFDEHFLSVTPIVFIAMIFSLVCLSVSISVTAKYFCGRPIPEKQKRIYVTQAGKKIGLGSRFSRALNRDKLLYMMLLLPVSYYILFYYLPFDGLRMAFYDFSLLRGYGDFIGLEKFREFFMSDMFWRVLRNTLLLNIYTLLWSFPMPIILAILFNELRNKKFRTLAQTISYIPHFISTMVIAGLVLNLLSPTTGLINNIRGIFGQESIYFIMMPEYFRTIFISQHIWTTIGFGSIIYYSSLQSIDTELYESATLDGAGRFKQCIYISLPSISRTIAIMLIMAIGGLLASNVDMLVLLQQPVTHEVSDVIGTYLLRLSHLGPGETLGRLPDFSQATAVGLFNGVVACFLVVSANKVSKIVGDVSMF
ncbi:MAG: ABC transporter permease subunit [Defluviitaleaceae bacterium]|nr:ABC transporter permease subunit [Defluviitaleaceae bacterium]